LYSLRYNLLMNGPNIYQYLDYRRYLSDWFRAKKTASPRFSHRVFARQAGHSSPSLLLHVIEGKRNLTSATTEAFCKAIGLKGEDADFFAALVQLDQAPDNETRNRAWEQVSATRRFKEARKLEGDGVEYLSCWYYPAIRELALCQGFQADPEWIAQSLRPHITATQAKKALELLISLGFLKQEENRLVAAEASLVTPHEVAGMAAMNYHATMIERSKDALAFPHKERHYCAVTVSIPTLMLPLLKRELDAFQERLLDLCDGAEGAKDCVYQINLQLLPLSGRTDG
jgi:uncharacterized protein (TIGR02147 family)